MTKWEYLVIDLLADEKVLLNHYGDIGWELVSVCVLVNPASGSPLKRQAYFKRPKQ